MDINFINKMGCVFHGMTQSGSVQFGRREFESPCPGHVLLAHQTAKLKAYFTSTLESAKYGPIISTFACMDLPPSGCTLLSLVSILRVPRMVGTHCGEVFLHTSQTMTPMAQAIMRPHFSADAPQRVT